MALPVVTNKKERRKSTPDEYDAAISSLEGGGLSSLSWLPTSLLYSSSNNNDSKNNDNNREEESVALETDPLVLFNTATASNSTSTTTTIATSTSTTSSSNRSRRLKHNITYRRNQYDSG